MVEDPSLLWLFLEKECTSLHELPLLGALPFRLISERLFTHLPSPDTWGKTRVEFITNTSWKISGKTTPMVILITDGVGEGNEYGDHLLPPWSSQNWGLWCTLQPTSKWLTEAKCGCSEKIHQHPLYPLRDFPFLLSRHEHFFWGHFLCPIPTGPALSMQATPFL